MLFWDVREEITRYGSHMVVVPVLASIKTQLNDKKSINKIFLYNNQSVD